MVYISLFIISLTSLSLESLFIRGIGIIEDSRGTFTVISAALFGLGIGGALAFAARGRWINRSFGEVTYWISLVVSILPTFVVLAWELSPSFSFPYILSLIALPFLFIGMYTAYCFSLPETKPHFLYAADLAGAATGMMLAIAFISSYDPFKVIPVVGLIPAALFLIAGLFRTPRSYKKGLALYLIIALIFLLWTPDTIDIGLKNNRKGMFRDINRKISQGKETPSHLGVWNNIYGRLDLIRLDKVSEDLILNYVDGAVPALMFVGAQKGEKSVSQLDFCLCSIPYRWGSPRKTLIIGTGGGFDVFIARRFNIPDITSVELNPTFWEVIDRFSEVNGNLKDSEDVKWIWKEGRSYLRETPERYDLISLSLVQLESNRAYAIGHPVNYLYTLEAFDEYFSHLNEGGHLAIVTHSPLHLTKLINTAIAYLESKGNTYSKAIEQIAAFRTKLKLFVNHNHLMLLKKGKIGQADYDNLIPLISKYGFTVLHFPINHRNKQLISHVNKGGVRGIVEKLRPWDAAPTTDEHPAFFNISTELPPYIKQNLIIFAVIFSALIITFLIKEKKRIFKNPRIFAIFSIAFFLSGVGFMLFQVTFINKLHLFLRHPTLTPVFAIFCMLAAGGAGSLLAKRIFGTDENRIAVLSGIFLLLTSLFLWGGGYNTAVRAGDQLSFLGRFLVAFGLVGPSAFFMGALFPAIVSRAKDLLPVYIPFFWGVNAFALVFGSLLALMIQFYSTLSGTFLAAGIVYITISMLMFKKM